MTNTFFLTGTDTEVGKTVASIAILQAVAKKGLTVSGYKPIAAGCRETLTGLKNGDALRLQECSTNELTYEEVNPCLLNAACSPHIAATLEGKEIDFDLLSSGLAHLKSQSEFTLVEGAGGWRVPVTHQRTLADWVKSEKLQVIVVVGIKLGCLNHAYLTAEAIRRDGLNIVGWVANRINPGVGYYAEIVKTLETYFDAPKLGEIPYLASIKSRDLSQYIDADLLL